MRKYEWHFHNEQGAFLCTIISTSEHGARRIFRKSWSGKAKVTQGHAV